MSIIVLANGEVLRPCKHKGTIILDMEAVCTGVGNAEAVEEAQNRG